MSGVMKRQVGSSQDREPVAAAKGQLIPVAASAGTSATVFTPSKQYPSALRVHPFDIEPDTERGRVVRLRKAAGPDELDW